jgi:hypothetical protein
MARTECQACEIRQQLARGPAEAGPLTADRVGEIIA